MHSNPSIPPVPTNTARAAKAVYNRSNLYLSVGDQLAVLLNDISFENTDPRETPSRMERPLLALVTFFQYLEKLSDRQAAEATQTRIDWKYALHLSMTYRGVNQTDLCAFRQQLLSHHTQRQDFQRLLDRLGEGGYTKDIQGQSLESMQVLTEVCMRTRLDKVMACMRNVLQALATQHTEWLRKTSLPYWYSRYEVSGRKPDLAESIDQQRAKAEAIGADIAYLLEAINQADNPQISSLNEVQELYQIWREQYQPGSGMFLWRENFCTSCSIISILESIGMNS